jgi:signal transduction histidine kinase
MIQSKILIVEDELIAAESLALDLTKLGYEVISIVNKGEKAITKISESKPDLILMDIMLKGEMDGITAAEKIYEQWQIPIVYLTAYGDVKTLERATHTGAYGYLIKPYKLVDISSTITMAIAKYNENLKVQENLAKQEKINEIKTQALATASHDLRGPLTSILGYTELLRDYGGMLPEDKKSRYFEYIKTAVGDMNESLEELLLISKVEEGKLQLHREDFDVVKFFSHIIDKLSLLTKKHQLKFIPSHSSYQVFLDKKILAHIVHNLLNNAVKYSPEGGEIKIELTCTPKQIFFSVQDQGIGIPQDYKKQLFQLFQRGSNVGKIKGNGLGLSIVKQAVDLHGGKIEVKSQEGIGSKFTVYIPQINKQINIA